MEWKHVTFRHIVLIIVGFLLGGFLFIYFRLLYAESLAMSNALVCNNSACPFHVNENLVWSPGTDGPLQTVTYLANALGMFVISEDQRTLGDLMVHQVLYQKQGWDNRKAMGCICSSTLRPKTWLIFFRGTQTLSDVLVDIKINQTSYPYNPHGTQPKVHSGFFQAYQGLRDSIISALPLNTPHMDHLVIFGYSLGGAMATLAGLDILQQLTVSSDTAPPTSVAMPIEVYTLASPAVGNSDFCDIVDRASPQLTLRRVVNLSDVVPTMPKPVSANIMTPYQPIIYTQSVQTLFLQFSDNRMSTAKNHFLPVYIDYLNRLWSPPGVHSDPPASA